MDAPQIIFVFSDRKQCGKSLVGDIFADLTEGNSVSISDYIKPALEKLLGRTLPDLPNDDLREALYHTGLAS